MAATIGLATSTLIQVIQMLAEVVHYGQNFRFP